MEIIAAVLSPLVQCVAPSIAKRWEYHRDIKKNMADLRESLETLKAREAGYKRKLEASVVSGKIEVADEVKLWLERVEKYNRDVDEIGNKVTQVKFFSRASLRKRVFKMKLEVDKHYGAGQFADDDLVRVLPQRGKVKPTEMILGGQTTTKKMMDEILECLADENVKRIGLHGMGGIGKTTVLEHVHNDLLKGGNEIGSKFDKVIWITVSNDCGLTGLQDKIASELELRISKDDDKEKRATTLFEKFNENNKRFLLILDDMWEAYRLKKVGIPNPTPENGCKLVLTTRSRDVCREMECDPIIEMGFLPQQEARDLFLEKVGQEVASDPKLGDMVSRVAKECAGLPLAIVTVAGSLRDEMDPIEWNVALAELKDITASVSSKITAILRFSYDRLKDEKLKDCLLYCALYPEDFRIERSLLIDQLIAEGIVEVTNTSQSPAEKGHVMLNNLVRNCLLIETKNRDDEKCVKLHDSIRDMAIEIMRESPSRFVTEKREEIWNEHVERVSLMGTRIPFTEPPKCPRLSTLLLSENYKLERLSENFFPQMEGLCVLDLSRTAIKTLPESVSVLVNLVVLSLAYCRMLVHVPDLSELRKLRRLDLHATGITEVPKGMETMEKLTFLDLSRTELLVTAEDLVHLRKLETLRVNLAKLEDLNAYVRSSNSGKLTNFYLQVGADEGPPFDFRYNHVSLSNINECVEGGCGFPENVERIEMNECQFSVQGLCCLTSVENISNLVRVYIIVCNGLEWLFYYASAIFPLLQKIEDLDLHGLDNLRGVFCTEGGGLASLPPGSLSSLKRLSIGWCENLKKLLVLADASLPNLEEIDIKDCEQLEEIITSNEEADDLTVNNYTVTLPKLKTLQLESLPKLRSIPFVADSLKSVRIEECDNLKKLLVLADASLPNLEDITIGFCEQLEEIMTSNEEADDLTVNNYTVTLPKLKHLGLHWLPKLKTIPFVADSLERLYIDDCDNLKKLLVLADASLPNLEDIEISSCDQLEEIISSNEEADDLTVNYYTVTLPKLKKLKLFSLPKLEEIITSNEEADDLTDKNYTVTLPKLKELSLWGLPKLKSIPFVADSLKSVGIQKCSNLKKLLVLADASLPNLEHMYIEDCEQLEEIITSNEEADDLTVNNYTVTLPKLKTLKLKSLPKLRSIPFVADSLMSVEILNVNGCDNLKKLLVLADASLPNLKDISICGCKQLEEIITSNEEADDLTVNNYTVTLPQLKTLQLESLPKLRSIPFVADSLMSVKIKDCRELKSIFFLDGDQCPPSLQSIEIDAEPWKSRRYSLSL